MPFKEIPELGCNKRLTIGALAPMGGLPPTRLGGWRVSERLGAGPLLRRGPEPGAAAGGGAGRRHYYVVHAAWRCALGVAHSQGLGSMPSVTCWHGAANAALAPNERLAHADAATAAIAFGRCGCSLILVRFFACALLICLWRRICPALVRARCAARSSVPAQTVGHRGASSAAEPPQAAPGAHQRRPRRRAADMPPGRAVRALAARGG